MADTPQPLVLPAYDKTRNARVLASPFQFFLSGNEKLRVTSWNSLAGVRLAIQGRTLEPDGTYKPLARTHTCTSDRLPKVTDYALGGSQITNLIIFAFQGAPLVGQTFVKVQIIQGEAPAETVLGTMLQGYVTANGELGWPGSPIQSSLEGGGYLRSIAGTSPAPTTAISETVPNNARWELVSMFAEFAATAAVGDRAIQFQMSVTGVGFVAFTIQQQPITAGQTRDFIFAQGLPSYAYNVNAFQHAAVPAGISGNAGDKIVVSAGGMQIGDAFAQPLYQVKEWIVP